MCASLIVAAAATQSAETPEAVKGQRKELEQIKRDVRASQERLDSLRREELRVQKQISEFDQRLNTHEQVIKRLNSELRQLDKGITEAESVQKKRQEKLESTQRRFLSNLRQYYLTSREPSMLMAGGANSELEANRRLVLLGALAHYESGNIASASVVLAESLDELKELQGEGSEMLSLKRQKERTFAMERSRKLKQEKVLTRLRRKSKEESDRVVTLQNAAREIEKIIERLEKQQLQAARRQPEQKGSSVFAALKGQLAAPFKGKVQISYGNSIDPVTRLKSFSPGIAIRGRAGGKVVAVAAGTVVYRGELRGYGGFVIINHDGQYYTTYAGLANISVSTDLLVRAGSELGKASADGLVRFELRKGSSTLDPIEWIDLESL